MSAVLIVEDDPALLRGLSDNFTWRGYHVETAADGEAGLEKAQRLKPDLLILDVMLPYVNGYEICRYLRQAGLTIPTIFLTAKDEESDVLLGLGLGADDYMTKPFSVKELLARAGAVLRRCGVQEEEETAGPDEQAFGEFRLDTRAHKLRGREGTPVKLSPTEYDLLAYFLRHPGKALSRAEIMDAVWGYGNTVTSRSVDRFVTGLRKKIESDPANPVFIETIREFGYRFRSSVPAPRGSTQNS